MEQQRGRYHQQCTFLCLMWMIRLSASFRCPAVAQHLQRHHRLMSSSTTAVASTTTRRTTRIAVGRAPGSARTNAVPAATQRPNNNNNKSSSMETNRWKQQTGGLRRLPVIPPTIEIRNRAKRAGLFTKADGDLKNARQRAKKHGAETLNALSQRLCLPLRDTVRLYERTLRNLHPFEQVVAELTVRNRQKVDGVDLHHVLSELHEARKLVLEATKDWIAKVKDAPTAREADDVRKEGSDALLKLFTDVADSPISHLVELQKALRNAPIVQLNVPTMVLVGYPNVGKSSIVKTITTATNIEVNNYPFTTRGLTIGHYDICWQHYDDNDDDDNGSISSKVAIPYEGDALVKHRCQVMDSPGVLNRVDRNAMELLTVAAMQHLPTAVCFVVDLSKTAVSTIPDQLAVRQTLRARFPKRPWLDVATKADVEFDPDGEQEWRRLCDDQGIVISIEQDIGVEELTTAVADCLGQVQLVLAAMTALKESNGGE